MAGVYTNYPYLLNEPFLKIIDDMKLKAFFCRVTLLSWEENPIEQIEGEIMSGNFNLDGNSSSRRTGSLSFCYVDNNIDYFSLSFKFSINKKIKVEIGIKNDTGEYSLYPIIWFPLGVFVIGNCSISHSLQNVSVNLSLKDKMSLLNGECGGTLPASVNFGEVDTLDEETQTLVLKKPPIYQIITELVNHFGKEQLGKILISDLEKRIKQVVKWNYHIPLWIYIENVNSATQHVANVVVQEQVPANQGTGRWVKYEKGQDCGYINTDFTYPGELIGDAGNTVTDILDKIKNTLGNYEYFYDINGFFHFQEIKNYLNTRLSSNILARSNERNSRTVDTIYYYNAIDNAEDNKNYIVDKGKGTAVYDFTNSDLIISINNNPQYNNIKNDFIVWGKRKGVDGTDYPIRYHLAIDKKPTCGKKYYCTNGVQYDKDWDRYYFTDLSTEDSGGQTEIITSDWRTQLYLEGAIAEKNGTYAGDYYAELSSEWPKMYDIENNLFKEEYIYHADTLDFYLDFIDTSSQMGNYSVSKIGRRTKVLVDDSINCIFEPEIPEIFYIPTTNNFEEKAECQKKYQNYCQLTDEQYANLVIGGVYNGADNAIKDLLYQYTNYNENVSMTTTPIYHLEPNTRIRVSDKMSGVNDEFIIKTISFSLGHNATTNITMNKALTKI